MGNILPFPKSKLVCEYGVVFFSISPAEQRATNVRIETSVVVFSIFPEPERPVQKPKKKRENIIVPVAYPSVVLKEEHVLSDNETTKEYTKRLTKIYKKKREATKLQNCLKMMKTKYAKDPHELYVKVCEKYNLKCEPRYVPVKMRAPSEMKSQLDNGEEISLEPNAVIKEYIER